MKKTASLLALLLLTTMPVLAQTKKGKQMEKREFNPWEWQNQRSYVPVSYTHLTLPTTPYV